MSAVYLLPLTEEDCMVCHQAFQSLKDVSSELGLESIIPIPCVSSAEGPFLCVCCFKSLERYAKVKASLNQLDNELKNKMKSVAATLSVKSTSFSIPR